MIFLAPLRQAFAILSVAVAALVATAATGSGALGKGPEISKGKALAQRWCASCHVVAPGQTKASADVPSFAQISKTRTIAQIRGALVASHTRMPDMALSRSEIDDLTAYLQTLAPPLDPMKPAPEKDNPPKTHRG
ncbi:MAG: cytochrome c [Beijerinckiaceae bacterium]